MADLRELRQQHSGPAVFTGTSTNLTHVATGFIFFGYLEYITTFDITPVSLPAGAYWLALHNGPLTNDTNFSRIGERERWDRHD